MRKDWTLFTDIILIILIGLTTLYSTVIGEENVVFGGGVFNKQLVFVVIGLALYFILTYSNYKLLQYPQVFGGLYIITVVLLVLLLIFGVEINQVKRWIQIAGFRFQVSEVAKFIVIVTTVGVMSMRNSYNEYLLAGISFLLTLVISVLVFLEPDASTAIVIMMIWFLTAFASMSDQLFNIAILLVLGCSSFGMILFLTSNMIPAVILVAISVIIAVIILVKYEKFKIVALGALVIGLLLGFFGKFAWNNILQDYQRERIESFIEPEEDVQ
jgi:cell division protein FtsW (lipid II flippase)